MRSAEQEEGSRQGEAERQLKEAKERGLAKVFIRNPGC